MTNHSYEIMAPAGSWESLAAAIQAGADSVYFGIEKLNMRFHSSANFTTADLPRIVQTCRDAGVKSYLTVNTVIYQEDLPLMREIVDTAKQSGVTAIIAADVAVLQYAFSQGVEVHLSTQLNIANIEALKFYAQFADVVVLARELNMDQVAEIHREIEAQQIRGPKGELIRIEMFCHGALCMAVSGKCYLSLHHSLKSANRGACMQVCRRAYDAKEYDPIYTLHDQSSDIELDVTNPYIMSPKDLKTIHFLNKMLDAGVRVLKIEGRARGPEYVRQVVSCYKEAAEAWTLGTYNKEMVAAWDERLSRVFNRGFWNGYYLGQRLGEWTSDYGNLATRKKVYVGKCTNFFKKIGVAEILVESDPLDLGQEYLVTGETTGAVEGTMEDMRVDDKSVGRVEKGTYFSFKPKEEIRRGDRLYKLEIVNQKI